MPARKSPSSSSSSTKWLFATFIPPLLLLLATSKNGSLVGGGRDTSTTNSTSTEDYYYYGENFEHELDGEYGGRMEMRAAPNPLLRNKEAVELKDYVDRGGKSAPKYYYREGRARAFLGVPYARLARQANDKLGIFRRAQPLPPVEPVADKEEPCTMVEDKCVKVEKHVAFGSVCPQFSNNEMNEVVGSEGCLYLNIYTPMDEYGKVKTPRNHPVFIYFHGGELMRGASNDLGVNGIVNNLVSRGIVVVTPNYRLGAPGFYKFDDNSQVGDELNGLWDQLLALHYVYININHGYGGNNSRITIAGHDASACTAAYIAMLGTNPNNSIEGVPIGKMFQRVVMMSGSSNYCRLYNTSSAWTKSDQYRKIDMFPKSWKLELPYEMMLHPSQLLNRAREASKAFGKKSFLIGVNVHDFTGIYSMMNETHAQHFFGAGLVDDFYNKGTLARFITRLDKMDMLFYAGDKQQQLGTDPKRAEKLANTLYTTYMDLRGLKETVHVIGRTNVFFRILSDAFFSVMAVRDARAFHRLGHDVYLYRFDYIPASIFTEGLNPNRLIDKFSRIFVPFGVELPYLFMQDRYWREPLNFENHNPMAQLMADIWAKFIHDGRVIPKLGAEALSPRHEEFGRFDTDRMTDVSHSTPFIQIGELRYREWGEPVAGSGGLLHMRNGGFIPHGVEKEWQEHGAFWDNACGRDRPVCA